VTVLASAEIAIAGGGYGKSLLKRIRHLEKRNVLRPFAPGNQPRVHVKVLNGKFMLKKIQQKKRNTRR